MSIEKVLSEVSEERIRQDGKWGGPEHDDTHSVGEFCRFIDDKSLKASLGSNPEKVRYRLVQVAALAVAAVESIDRKGLYNAEAGRIADQGESR